jgi:GntR family transcriptional regulator
MRGADVTDLPLKLSDATGVPYYRQIVDQVGELIRSGRLSPDDQLPSVRELAARLLVSLITTRRAYADLEAQGLIVRRQGQGTFVAKEIEMASHEQAINEATERISDAVHLGRRLGLDDRELESIFTAALAAEGGRDERR